MTHYRSTDHTIAVDGSPSREQALALVEASKRGDYRAMTHGDAGYVYHLCYQAYGYPELEPGNWGRRLTELWMAMGNRPVPHKAQTISADPGNAPPITYGMSPRRD